MSALTAGIIAILVGICSLMIRLFFFVDLTDVEKSKLNQMKLNSASLVALSILGFISGTYLLVNYSHNYEDSLNRVYNDLVTYKIFFAGIFAFLGIIFLVYKENIFKGWKEKGMRVPKQPEEYRIHIILIGFILVIIGILLFSLL